MEFKILSKEEFLKVLVAFGYMEESEYDTLYELYLLIFDGIKQVALSIEGLVKNIDNNILVLYLLNEYNYSMDCKGKEEFTKLINTDDEFFSALASICADKYLTNENLNYKSKAFLNRFNPPVSTLDLYLNFILRTLENTKVYARSDHLVLDMLNKAFSMSKCILSLLINGFETEAFSTWRTLHENECILLCLVKNGENMFNEYFKHTTYALAYRGQIGSKEETDQVFVKLKDEMKEHGLKSKDMKKFIEYGYLYACKNIEDYPQFKLNFRDGVETIAGLSNYSKVYEMASEIAHSSPLLLYSRRSYFYEITILNLYESFFRLENIFEILYKGVNSEELYLQYKHMKTVYMSQLQSIYRIYRNNFFKNHLQNKNDQEVKNEKEKPID